MDTRYINIYYVLEHFCFFSVEVKSANVFFLLSDIEMDEFMPNYINWTIYFIFKNNELQHIFVASGIHNDMDYIFQLMTFYLFFSTLRNLPLILLTTFYLLRLYLE